jgi:biopolymer transport protein ExbB
MENVKSYLIIAALFTAVLFATPITAAQANGPSGGAGQTVNSTTDSETPGVVTKERKTLWGLVKSGGLIMVPLGLLALYGFYKAGEQIYVIIFSNGGEKDQLLLQRLNPQVTHFEEMGGIIGADVEQRAKAAFPPMCAAALERVYQGKEAMEEALVEEGVLQLGRLKRGIKPLQGVVMVAPLLGLLGTVYGMIASFQSLGSAGDDKVEFLSEGIYEALVTTATGLTIAIPFLFLYLWLNRRADEVGENLNRQARVFLGALFPVEGGYSGDEPAAQESQDAVDPRANVT